MSYQPPPGSGKWPSTQPIVPSRLNLPDGLIFQTTPHPRHHCLFHAVGLYLDEDETTLRQRTADYMKANANKLVRYSNGTRDELSRRSDEMRKSDMWADQVEIEAIQQITNRPIIIIRANASPIIPKNLEQYPFDPIFIYDNGRYHYDAFTLQPDITAREILNNILPRRIPIDAIANEQKRPVHSQSTGQIHARLAASEQKAQIDIVGFGQNSIGFSAIQTLRLHKVIDNALVIEDGNKTVLIMQDFWLDHVHESRLGTEWGQTPRDFPLDIRHKILELYPSFNLDQRITFGMFKRLRQAIFADLQQEGVTIIQSNISDIQSEQRGSQQILKVIFTDRPPETFLDPKRVINTLNTIRPNEEITDAVGNQLPPQTKLYELPKGTAPQKLIIFGLGLSGVWVSEQCAESDIRYMVDDREKAKETLSQLTGRNRHNNISLNQCYVLDKVNFRPANNLIELDETNPKKQVFIRYLEEHRIPARHFDDNYLVAFEKGKDEILFIAHAYNATGYVPRKFQLPHVTNIHFERPARLTTGAVPVAPEPRKQLKRPVAAPQNLPGGALMDRYTDQMAEYARISKLPIAEKVLFIPFEILNFHDIHEKWLAECMKQNGIGLTDKFFQKLREKVKSFEDVPAEPLTVIKEVYRTTYQTDYRLMRLREKFNDILDIIMENRQEMIRRANTNTQSNAAALPIQASEYQRNKQRGQSASSDNPLAHPLHGFDLGRKPR